MSAKHGEGWGFSLESVNFAIGASMPPASQFFTAAAPLSTHATVRLAPQAEADFAHRSHDSAPSSSSKSMLSPLAYVCMTLTSCSVEGFCEASARGQHDFSTMTAGTLDVPAT